MTHIVLALVWLTAGGHLYRADIAVSQRHYVAASECNEAARQLHTQVVLSGVVPSQAPTTFRFSCQTEL